MSKKKDVRSEESTQDFLSKLSFDDFKSMFVTKAFTRVCPYFCISLRCPFVVLCWEIKKRGGEEE